MSDDVVIFSAARTPVGSFNGASRPCRPMISAPVAIKAALERAGIEAGPRLRSHHGPDPDRGAGQNPARQGLDRGRISGRKPGWGVNPALRQRLAHGRAWLSGAPQRRFGNRRRRRPGIHEHGPHAQYLRGGTKMGRSNYRHHDQGRPWDAFNGYHMGNTAENVARQYQITRSQQDEIRGRFPEQGRGRPEGGASSRTRSSPVTIKTRKGDIIVADDEISAPWRHPRRDGQAQAGLRKGRAR